MKKHVYSTLIALGLLAAVFAPPANAQFSRRLSAKVPFDFTVLGKTLPAGNYILEMTSVGASEALKIQSADGKTTALVQTRMGAYEREKAEPRLVFKRFGDQHFLAQVEGLNETGIRELLMPKFKDRSVRSSGASSMTIVVAVLKNR